jgi:hypothetical protein
MLPASSDQGVLSVRAQTAALRLDAGVPAHLGGFVGSITIS